MSEREHNDGTGAAAPPRPGDVRWPLVVRLQLSTAVMTGLLVFVPAGRIAWGRGWLFVAAVEALFVGSLVYLRRANPGLFTARRGIHRRTKRWDKILLAFMLPATIGTLPVAAADAGRFGGSPMAWPVVVLGYVLLVAGWTLTTWAQGANRFFEVGVRIQDERGHRVIDGGPYAIVRHPGYAASFGLLAGMALALGSWWALIPAAVASVLLVLRTALEDRTLRAELPGYAAYARRVRFRLIPGLW